MVGYRRVGGRRKAEHEQGHRHADRSHAPAHVPFEEGHRSVLTFLIDFLPALVAPPGVSRISPCVSDPSPGRVLHLERGSAYAAPPLSRSVSKKPSTNRPKGGSRADCNLRPFASQTLPGPPRPDSPPCREHRGASLGGALQPIDNAHERERLRGLEAAERSAPRPRVQDRDPVAQNRRIHGRSAVTIEDQPQARPSTRYLDLLANRPFENRRPRDLTVTADDLLAVTPVMLEACVLRSTVRLTARNGDGHREPVPLWTSSSDGSLRRKKNRPPVGGRFSYRASQNGAY